MDLGKAISATQDLVRRGKIPVAIFCSPITLAQLAEQSQMLPADEMTIGAIKIYADDTVEPTAFDVGFDEAEVQRRLGLIRLRNAAAKLSRQ